MILVRVCLVSSPSFMFTVISRLALPPEPAGAWSHITAFFLHQQCQDLEIIFLCYVLPSTLLSTWLHFWLSHHLGVVSNFCPWSQWSSFPLTCFLLAQALPTLSVPYGKCYTRVHANPFMSISAKSVLQLTDSAGIEINDESLQTRSLQALRILMCLKPESIQKKEKPSR